MGDSEITNYGAGSLEKRLSDLVTGRWSDWARERMGEWENGREVVLANLSGLVPTFSGVVLFLP